MRTTWIRRWELATRVFLWVLMGLAVGAVNAQTLTMKDTRGRAIEVRIISATDTHVACIKSSDKKEVTIALDTLDAESQKRINDWRIETGRLPRKEMSRIITSYGSKPKKYLMKFKVPEGNYNSTLGDSNGIQLKFDKLNQNSSSGTFYIDAQIRDQKIDDATKEIFREFQEELARRLGRMNPSDRIAQEPTMKIQEVSHGDFKGYLLPENTLGSSRQVKTTNGKFTIFSTLYVSPRRTEKTLIEPDDIVKILETLEIEKHP